MKKYILPVLLILLLPFVMADNYTPVGANDFSVYIDPNPYLDGKMYATIDMTAAAHIDHDHKCYTMIFINETGSFTHVQSNPTLASSSGISLRIGKTTPEEIGYFSITEGMGTVYWRKHNQVAGANFLYVVKCTTDTETLIWESTEVPEYRELGKTLPGRFTWFASQEYLGWVFFTFILLLILVYAIAKLIGRR